MVDEDGHKLADAPRLTYRGAWRLPAERVVRTWSARADMIGCMWHCVYDEKKALYIGWGEALRTLW